MDSQGWTAVIQTIICLALLIINLGPSAIAGFAFFVLATPPQTMVLKQLFAIRRKSMVWTDKRAKLLQELLGGMKVIKFFAWETSFLKRLVEYRQKEMACV
jgi:ABC-type bacteriocin/lantibiotic exporter with double-glycine peptidase domain